MRRLLLSPLLMWSMPLAAQTIATPARPPAMQAAAPTALSTPTPAAVPTSDGRLFGHFPYADVGQPGLVLAAPGFAVGQPCRLQPVVANSLALLLSAKAASGVPGTLHGVSCYRSIAHQQSVFCRGRRLCRDPASRSRQVAPPGYSEHETGYAIDFAVRPAPGCPDTSDCIAATPAGKWLIANGPRFGFELSFPVGNAQGVTWEPWHWRWVGVNGDDPDAARARALFAQARVRFPAFPAVMPLVIRVAEQPPIPLGVLGTPKSPPIVKLPKDKKQRRG
jgi:D-alanyl-D-alanine carboxypeptidase